MTGTDWTKALTRQRSWTPLGCLLLVAVLVAVPVVALLTYYMATGGFGVSVSVSNVGDDAIHDVVVHLRGGPRLQYEVGTIAPGDAREVDVEPGSETDVRVTWTTSDGVACEGLVDVYLEDSSRGTVAVEVRGQIISAVDNDTLPMAIQFRPRGEALGRGGPAAAYADPFRGTWTEHSDEDGLWATYDLGVM